MKVHVSDTSRHLVLRAGPGETLPHSIATALVSHGVTAGWVRASGVLENVELRALDSEAGVQGAARRLAGRAQVIALEGSVGVTRGELSFGMRAILARETDSGLQTLAGEIVSAKIVALELVVSAFDDLALTRDADADAGIVLVSGGTRVQGVEAPTAPTAPVRAPAAVAVAAAAAESGPAWADAAAASAEADRAPSRPLQSRPLATTASVQNSMSAVVPQRIIRPKSAEEDTLVPEAGDSVEHFAFGTGDVVKSDGDRLHIRVGKEGKIREIALEMLKVTALENDGEKRRFRLQRKL